MTDLINKLPILSNPELAELLRLNHRTPEYRDAIVNEAIARLLMDGKRSPSPTWGNKAEDAFWEKHDK